VSSIIVEMSAVAWIARGSVVAVGLIAYGMGLYFAMRTTPEKLRELELEVLRSTDAPYTESVRQWLQPQLIRRGRWIGAGFVTGLACATVIALILNGDDVWFGLWPGMGMAAGTTVATILVAFRAFPRTSETVRAANVERRQVSDYVSPLALRAARLTAPLPIAAVTLGVAYSATVSRDRGLPFVVFALVGSALVNGALWGARIVVARPLIAESPDQLVWHEALLRRTVGPMVRQATGIATICGLVGVYGALAPVVLAVMDGRTQPPVWLPACGLLLLGVIALIGVDSLYRYLALNQTNLVRRVSTWLD